MHRIIVGLLLISLLWLGACSKVAPLEFETRPDTLDTTISVEDDQEETLSQTELPTINDEEIIIQPDF